MLVSLMAALAIQATTTCQPGIGQGVTVCSHQPAPEQVTPAPVQTNPNAFADGMRAGAALSGGRRREETTESREDRLVRMCATRSIWNMCMPDETIEARRIKAERDAASELRATVTNLIADGDCPGAVSAALRAGNMALAREAREFCTP